MKTNWQDPLSGEIISPDIAGLQEAVGKLEDALDMKVVNATNIPLEEIYISENDHYRIYQAPGKRNWVSSPAPVIKVNGTPISSGFTVNYGGGAVVFEPPLTVADVVTADFSYVTDVSNRLDTQETRLDTQENTLNTHLNNTADAFDEAKTYAVGDYCIYNNALYRCIVAVETAGEWNPDNWVATSVGVEIMAHKAETASKHITESGSNDDGWYVRLDDGTQVCWHRYTVGTVDCTVQIANAVYSWNSTGSISLTFPMPFKKAPAAGSQARGNRYLNSQVSTTTTTTITMRNWTNYSTADAVIDCEYIAIERWK